MYDSTEGDLTGATAVTIVDQPTAGTRVVRTITIHNPDTAAVTLTIEKVIDADSYIIWSNSLGTDKTFIFGEGGEIIVLDATMSVTAKLSADAATTEPTYVTAYEDVE